MRDALEAKGIGGAIWLVGGNIPSQDHGALRDIGVDGVFQTGTPFENIVEFIREKVQS